MFSGGSAWETIGAMQVVRVVFARVLPECRLTRRVIIDTLPVEDNDAEGGILKESFILAQN